MFRTIAIRLVGCAAILACLGPSAAAQGGGEQKIKRIVYDVKQGVARDLADVLGQVFKANSQVEVLPAPTGNALAIRAPAEVTDEILKLLQRLDRRPRMVQVEVLIAEVTPPKREAGKPAPPARELNEREFTGNAEDAVAKLHNLQKKGLIGELRRFRLSAGENQTDSVKVGKSKPYVISIGPVRNGVATRSIMYRDVGTTIKATLQIGADRRIVLQLSSIKDSQMRAPDDGAVLGVDENGVEVRATVFPLASFEGKVTVRSGEIAVADGVRVETKTGRHQTLVLVTARIVEPDAKAGKQ